MSWQDASLTVWRGAAAVPAEGPRIVTSGWAAIAVTARAWRRPSGGSPSAGHLGPGRL